MSEYEAGRELDALVAERLGLGPVERDYPCGIHPGCCEYEAPETRERATHFDDERHPVYHVRHPYYNEAVVVPWYSTDIAAAWTLVEKASETGNWAFGQDLIDGKPWIADYWLD